MSESSSSRRRDGLYFISSLRPALRIHPLRRRRRRGWFVLVVVVVDQASSSSVVVVAGINYPPQ